MTHLECPSCGAIFSTHSRLCDLHPLQPGPADPAPTKSDWQRCGHLECPTCRNLIATRTESCEACKAAARYQIDTGKELKCAEHR